MTPKLNQLRTLPLLYEKFVEIGFMLLPLGATLYLIRFQDEQQLYMDHDFHIVATGFSVLLSIFIAYVSYRCYLAAPQPLLRHLTLSFIGFAVCYAPHSFFTLLAGHDMQLFLIYSPVSRAAMTVFILLAIAGYRPGSKSGERAAPPPYWYGMIAALVALDVLVYFVVEHRLVPVYVVRYALEGLCCVLATAGVLLIIRRGWFASHIMKVFALALVYTAQGAGTFMVCKPWTHLWWFAHVITALGFFVLSYVVVRAYRASGDLSQVYSLDEMVLALRRSESELNRLNESLSQSGAQLGEANRQLNEANHKLSILAMQDELTGCNNRRGFLLTAKREVARAARSHAPYCLLMLDLDHFKQVNDKHGHDVGDEVLKRFAAVMQSCVRPSDIVGRLGGEEFIILLPDTRLTIAHGIAERIRMAVASQQFAAAGHAFSVTASIGVTESLSERLEEPMHLVDALLYQAKHQGRNRIVDARA